MNENVKTIAFVGLAVVVSLGVWLTRPRLPELRAENELPEELFPEFDDPLEAASLEIIEYDETTATLKPFKVAQVEGEWSIPSHENYPADAEDHLAEAATGLMGLEPLAVAGTRPADHKEFGVREPDPDKLKPGDTGVGTRVEMRDNKNDVLLELIVGKQVPDREELRYVRVPGKDPVYTVKLSTDELSTKFEDWIEEDLLKLNTWDVRQVAIEDYSVDLIRGVQIPRRQMTLEYDDGDSKWKLVEDKAFRKEGWAEVPMAEDEELDTSKLNDMKYALDDLKIVDVARKPEGLSENLRDAGELKKDAESLQSLADRGFYPVQVGENIELLSTEGEVDVLMKDGVQYILRFGQVAGQGEQSAGDVDEETEEGEQEADAGMNRYLFVMAEFNPEVIPKPELQPLPGDEKAAEEEGSNGNGEPEKAEAGEEAAKAEPAEGADEKAEEETEEESDAEKERERIEKENQRKQEEYEDKVEKGQERVDELNRRFAEWYYVISNEVYQKIHLSREDVVKKKEAEEEEGTDKTATGAMPQAPPSPAAELEKLKEEGLEAGKAEEKPAAEAMPKVKQAEKAKPAEKKSEEAKPAAKAPAEAKPEAKESAEAKPAAKEPEEKKPAESKPAEAKPASDP